MKPSFPSWLTRLWIPAMLLVSFTAKAQLELVTDSLLKKLKTTNSDAEKISILLERLAPEVYLDNPVQAQQFCEQALTLAEKSGDSDALGTAYGWLAYLHEMQGNIALAIDYNNRSLILSRKLGNRKSEATVLNNLGAIYKDRGNIEQALSNHLKSLEIRIAIHDSAGMATSFNNLGIIYSNQGNIEKALEYYYRGLRLQEAQNDKEGISTALHNIGLVHKEQGNLDEAMKIYRRALHINVAAGDKYSTAYSLNAIGGILELRDSLDEALEYYNKSYQLREELNDKQGIAYCLRNIGGIKEKQNAPGYESYYEKSLALFTEIDDTWGKTNVMTRLGRYYLISGNPAKSIQLTTTSLKWAKELGYPSEIRDAAEVLRDANIKLNNWRGAFELAGLASQMRDSVENQNNRRETFRQQYRHEYEKKETLLRAEQEKKDALSASELKRQQTQKNAYLGGLSMILLFSGLLFHRFRVTQRQNIQIEKARNELAATLDELKNTQQQLIESEKLAAFGVMASRMAHEIQNPLNFVNNFSEMSQELIEEILNPAESGTDIHGTSQLLKANLEKIYEHGRRAQAIIKSLQEHINAGTAHRFFEEG